MLAISFNTTHIKDSHKLVIREENVSQVQEEALAWEQFLLRTRKGFFFGGGGERD